MSVSEILASEWVLWGLFISAFISSTLLPGGSEALVLALAFDGEHAPWLVWLVATLGNALGGMSSWGIGRLLAWRFPGKTLDDKRQQALLRVRRWGAPILLLSWLPLIGDPLCVAAGWLRIHPLLALLFITIGKAGRYAVLILLAS